MLWHTHSNPMPTTVIKLSSKANVFFQKPCSLVFCVHELLIDSSLKDFFFSIFRLPCWDLWDHASTLKSLFTPVMCIVCIIATIYFYNTNLSESTLYQCAFSVPLLKFLLQYHLFLPLNSQLCICLDHLHNIIPKFSGFKLHAFIIFHLCEPDRNRS